MKQINKEQKRNILVTRSEGTRQLQLNERTEHFGTTKDVNLEQKRKHLVEKMFKTKKKKREVVRARASEQRRKKTHKRWLKDETGAKKKSRTLIDARRVMLEEA